MKRGGLVREPGESNLCLLRFDDFSAEAFESELISPITRWRFQHCRTDLHIIIYLGTFADVRISCGNSYELHKCQSNNSRRGERYTC